MTCKERVLSAANLSEPDKTPFDMHFTKAFLQKLNRKYAFKDHLQIMNHFDMDIVDIRGIIDPEWAADFPYNKKLKNGMTYSCYGFITKPVATPYGEIEEHSGYILEDYDTLDQLEAFRWPRADWFRFDGMGERLRQYEAYAIMASGASVYQHPSLVRRLDNLLCDMAAQPEIARYIMDRYTDFYVDYFSRMFESAPGQIDILRIADDLGMQDRMLISLGMFEEYIAPRLKRIIDMAHSYNVKVMFHSCGAIYEYIDSLIDVGVDILDPVQITAKDMQPDKLIRDFGGKICFHGSIDTQYVLPSGGYKEIKENIELALGTFGKYGGFILAPSHSVQPDVSVENIECLHQIFIELRDCAKR